MPKAPVASALTFIAKAYANHLLWFTIGCVAGAVEAFIILSPYIVAASK